MYWIKSSYHHTPSRPVLLLSAFFVLSWMKERRFKSCCFYHDHAQIINSETTGSDDCSYIFCSIGLTRLLGRAMAAYLKVHATLNFVWSFFIVKCYKPWLQSSKNARVPFYPLHYQYFHILITIYFVLLSSASDDLGNFSFLVIQLISRNTHTAYCTYNC